MSKLSTLMSLAYCLLITGCGQPSSVPPAIEHDAYAKKLADGTYEVQLRYSVTTSGGPCLNIHSFSSTTSYATNWLYLNSIEQTASADKVILTTDQSEKDLAIKGMTGTISFDNGTMTVELQQPNYPDGVHMQGYAPYYLNGTYQVVTDSPPKPPKD